MKTNGDPTDGALPVSIKISIEAASKNTASESNEVAQEQGPVDRFRSVEIAATDFGVSMRTLWRYTTCVGQAASLTGVFNASELAHLTMQLRNREEPKSGNDIATLVVEIGYAPNNGDQRGSDQLRFPIRTMSEYHQCSDLAYSAAKAFILLHQTVLQQTVVIFERLLGEIVFHANLADSNNIFEAAEFSAKEILEMDSFDEARESIAYKQAQNFLRQDTHDQLKWLKETLKIDLFASCESLIPSLCESILRRHVIVHGTSYSTREYLRRRKKIQGLKGEEDVAHIDRPNARYISDTWQTVYSVGTVCAHLAMHRIAKCGSSSEIRRERREAADKFLTGAAFDGIKLGRFRTAEEILNYYLNKHRTTPGLETYKLMAKINLAQAYKWQGKEEDASTAIELLNVDCLNILFRLCAAALGDDIDVFVDYLNKAAAENEISANELLEWPIFQGMRKHADFKKWLSAAFKLDLESIGDVRDAPLVMGPSPEGFGKIVDVIVKAGRLDEGLKEGRGPIDEERP